MTRIRRGLLLLALATTVLVGGGNTTAHASFADSAPVRGADGAARFSVQAAIVDAPDVLTAGLDCTRKDVTMSMTWSASTSPRVTGYVVKVYFSDGFVQTENMQPANDLDWSAPISLFNATNYSLQYSVTTRTDYGWHAESVKTGSFRC